MALLLAAACMNWSCEYDDSALQQRVDDLENQVAENTETIATLQKLVDALNGGKYVVATEATENGYVLTFNDGSSVAVGKPGDVFFTSIEDGEDAVVITTADGRVITLPKTDLSAAFAEGVTGRVKAGETRELPLVLTKVADCMALCDAEGWKVEIDGAVLRCTAPETLTDRNTTAEVRLLIGNERGDFKMVKLTVTAYYELRTLTFEDGDYAGSGNYLGNKDWTSLVDARQYGGSLLYGEDGYSPSGYMWYDEGNTELASGLIDGGPFWNGGHAVSNYYMADFSAANYATQLAVSVGAEGAAGRNGSKNFCVQNGYVDASSWKTQLPELQFGDNVARIVDHMYVTNTSYVLHSLTYGDGFAAAAGDTTWFKIVATGYDADDNKTGEAEFFLCAGREIVKEWTKFELWTLGKVARITFNLQGSADLSGAYGLNTPAYFAYDDVAVRF